jgi:hypothetical protein
MSELAASVSHYALLIGIDAYLEKALKGCVRDVHLIKQYLDDMAQHSVQTYMLTASVAEGPTSSQAMERPEHRPTHRNVVNLLKQIACQAREGAFVYIHFSGHGTAMRPPPKSPQTAGFSNPSTGDLALNLLQEDTSKVDYLRGTTLARSLKAMVDKKLIVTLVLDCCFSGSVVRDDTSVRYLNYEPQFDIIHSTYSQQDIGRYEERSSSAYRKASLYPSWLVRPDGYTIITACGPTEVAKEIHVDGQAHGALSYFLAATFESFGGIGGRQHHIYQSMCARFRATPRHSLHNQHPMLYGNKDLNFFGRSNPRVGPAPLPITKDQNGDFQLGAGQAHGICEGDKFAVCPIDSTGSVLSQQQLITAEAISVGALTSDLKLPKDTFTGDAMLVASAVTNLSLHSFPIRLNIVDSLSETWTKALNEQQDLLIHVVKAQSQGQLSSFTVSEQVHGSFEVRDTNDRIVLCLPASPAESHEVAAKVLEAIQHLAQYELFKSLKNYSVKEHQNQFIHSFRVQLIRPLNIEISPGCLQDAQQQQVCTHQGCLIEVEEGESLQLIVENNSTRYALCVHVYSMGASWEVGNILRADYEVVPPPLSNKSREWRKGSSGTWSKKLKMTVPSEIREQGKRHCDDIIKVILTSQPTSFLSLELPELGECVGRQKPSKDRATGSFSSSEDWAALSFRIRTRVVED